MNVSMSRLASLGVSEPSIRTQLRTMICSKVASALTVQPEIRQSAAETRSLTDAQVKPDCEKQNRIKERVKLDAVCKSDQIERLIEGHYKIRKNKY